MSCILFMYSCLYLSLDPTLFLVGEINNNPNNFLYSMPSGRRKRQIVEDVNIPIFVEDLNITDEQREFCNDNIQCIFDLSVTEDETVAQATMEIDAETSMTQEEQGVFYNVKL